MVVLERVGRVMVMAATTATEGETAVVAAFLRVLGVCVLDADADAA